MTGDIYYKSWNPGNTYLNGNTYTIDGTAYELKPDGSMASSVMYTLTAESEAGTGLITDQATDPEPSIGANICVYDLGYGASSLDLASYNITASTWTNPTTVRVVANVVTSSAAGMFDFSGVVVYFRPHLDIQSYSTITLDNIDTTTDSISQSSGAGHITLSAPDGVTVNGTILAMGALGASASHGGRVTITSSDGPIILNNDLNNMGRGNNSPYGAVSITGTSITAKNIKAARSISDSSGEPLAMTSSAGGIQADDINTDAERIGGAVTINATGGSIQTGPITTKSRRSTTQIAGNVGGSIRITTDQNISVGALDAITTQPGTAVDTGASITLLAGTNVTVTGNIQNYVSGTSASSVGGVVTITATNGNIVVQGSIDSSSPAGSGGNLTLSAPNGTITLDSLAVTNFSSIALDGETFVTGAVTGLDDDILDNKIDDFFTSVTGNIYYDPTVPGNAYLDGNAYEIITSGFRLMPPNPKGTVVLVR